MTLRRIIQNFKDLIRSLLPSINLHSNTQKICSIRKRAANIFVAYTKNKFFYIRVF